MSLQTVANLKRWRGVILELVYAGHRKQESRLEDLSLWGLMQDLGHDVSRNDVITLVQNLGDRGYLLYKQDKNDWTNQVSIREIQITPRGVDLVERTIPPDPAVHLL